jgi:hypothetical protein
LLFLIENGNEMNIEAELTPSVPSIAFVTTFTGAPDVPPCHYVRERQECNIENQS